MSCTRWFLKDTASANVLWVDFTGSTVEESEVHGDWEFFHRCVSLSGGDTSVSHSTHGWQQQQQLFLMPLCTWLLRVPPCAMAVPPSRPLSWRTWLVLGLSFPHHFHGDLESRTPSALTCSSVKRLTPTSCTGFTWSSNKVGRLWEYGIWHKWKTLCWGFICLFG